MQIWLIHLYCGLCLGNIHFFAVIHTINVGSMFSLFFAVNDVSKRSKSRMFFMVDNLARILATANKQPFANQLRVYRSVLLR